jgi:peroxiredoxin Q/BCP
MNQFVAHPQQLAKIGESAPDFILHNSQGKEWRLSKYRGKVVALLFYAKDETIVCTKQLCSVRDHWTEYLETGAEIVGISDGTIAEHRRFAEHHDLPIPLLADLGKAVTKAYSHHWLPSWLTRAIVVINADGIVLSRKVMFGAFRPNNDEVIAAILHAKTELLKKELE